MAAGKANGSNGGSSASTSASASVHHGPKAPYFVNKWGYGRPRQPSLASETFAWKILPWKLIYALDLSLAFLLPYLLFGLPSHSSVSSYAYLILVPTLIVVLALPIFALVAIPASYLYSPSAAGCPEKYFTFAPSSPFGRRYTGRKVPILTLYEAYFSGEISLAKGDDGAELDLLTVLYRREEYVRYVIEWDHVVFFFTKFIPELLKHTRSQDVEQVREHYDRGDDFYAAFLGETMVYTSGIFNDEEDTLEQAQVNKLNLVAQKIHLQQGDVHLDLGCGWGTLIAHFAQQYGTDSTGITLGRNQTEWANNKCKKAAVDSRARALCMDYRDTPAAKTADGKYDKITCLEMSEHVGVKYYGRFCTQVYDMLKDDGVFFLQIAGLRKAWQFEDFNWGERTEHEQIWRASRWPYRWNQRPVAHCALLSLSSVRSVHGQVHLPRRRCIVPNQVSPIVASPRATCARPM